MQLKIIKGDITTIECDAIVSSARTNLTPGGAIDTAIHKAAGPELTKACHPLTCAVGNCVVTDAYLLPCRYIFHTVAPYSGYAEAAHLLANCYKNSIEKAKEKHCSSLAFPLIGSGHKGFSVEKAVSIAINRIDACMRNDEEADLLIYLVVYDEKAHEVATTQAKSIIKADCFIDDSNATTKTTASNEMAITSEANHWISLCRVNRPDKREDIWLRRIADFVDGELILFEQDKEREPVFDNRSLVFRENGPAQTDAIGFWEWKEVPKQSGGWKSDSSFVEELDPIEIIECDEVQSVEELTEMLKQGIDVPFYTHEQILFVIKARGENLGVFCSLNNFNVRSIAGSINQHLVLKQTTYTLPCYDISSDNIIRWDNRLVYSKIKLPEPVRKVFIHVPSDAIRQIILDRFMNWPVFKAKGISRSDWQKFKEFFSALPFESIYAELADAYGLDSSDVEEYVSDFLRKVETYIDRTDIDSSLFIQLIENHDVFKEICEKIAYAKWQEEHLQEVKSAQGEVDQLRMQISAKQAEAAMQLKALNDQLFTLESQKTSVRDNIAKANAQLAELQQTIIQHEEIGKQTVEAVRLKIADAQKNVADFMADLAMFMPQSSTASAQGKSVSLWQYDCSSEGQYLDEDMELAASWKDELNSLNLNFVQLMDVSPELAAMLSAFIYAAHLNNTPLLIAGPGGSDIAEILSASLYGSGSGQLTLGNECDYDVADELGKYTENVVSVRNMFGKGWSDILPQQFGNLKKHVIWTHPYVEDLTIEPKGLYNYMLPLVSECFVGTLASVVPFSGKRAEQFISFVSHKKNRLRIAAFSQLKLSKFLMARLEKILSDTKELMNNPNADKDIELLFGLIPLCVLTGKTKILREVIESDSGISKAVKDEAARYIEEE